MSAAGRKTVLDRYRSSIQRAVSCISSGVFATQRPRLRAVGDRFEAYSLALQGGDAILSESKPSLLLRVQHQFRLFTDDASTWHADVAGYFYVLEAPSGAEVVAYHWHAASGGDVAFPHVHIGVGATGADTRMLAGRFHKAHFPTGVIAIEDIIRLAITEFGARPRRSDWETILDTTRAMRAEA